MFRSDQWLSSRDTDFYFIYFFSPLRCLRVNLVHAIPEVFNRGCSVPSSSTDEITIEGRSQCLGKAQSLLCTTYSKQYVLERA